MDGKIVITVSDEVLKKRAVKTTLAISFLDSLRGRLSYGDYSDHGNYLLDIVNSMSSVDTRVLYKCWQTVLSENIMLGYYPYKYSLKTYFKNGMAAFYSETSGGVGFINDKGDIVIPPQVYAYDNQYDYEVIPVTMSETGENRIYNSDLEEIYTSENEIFDTYEIFGNCKLIVVHCDDHNIEKGCTEKHCIVMDYESNLINPDTDYIDCSYDDKGVLLTMEKEDSIYEAIDGKGNTIFESDKYSRYISCYDSNNDINCILAYNIGKKVYDLIDTNGNIISDNDYDRCYEVNSDYNYMLCRVADTGNLDIIYADGTVISTPYKYYWEGTYDYKIGVIREKEDGTSEYNYIDYDGNLIRDEWNELEEYYYK